jgi:Histidine kinase-like ATPase domain
MRATNGSPGQASGTAQASPAPVRRTCWRREFPGEERQLGVLRRWLASLLPPSAARDDVVTVANELGSNAILHTFSGRGGVFAVEVTWSGPVVRVAVADSGALGEPREADDPVGVHGRGLLLVRGLSARRGVWGDHCARLVWAEVPWDGAGAAQRGADAPYRPIPAMRRALFQRMQAFEDATAYRQARVALPCPACVAGEPGRRCDDHARDLELIAGYSEALQRLVPGPVAT